MDKDTVILKHQQETVVDIEADAAELHSSSEDQAQRLAAMQAKLSALGSKPAKNRPVLWSTVVVKLFCNSCGLKISFYVIRA